MPSKSKTFKPAEKKGEGLPLQLDAAEEQMFAIH
jgi:hypothetical protein